MEKDVRDLKDKIEQTELQLKQIAPEYEAAVAEEETANKELQAKKQRRTELYAKQNRGDRYKTKEDRDRYLNSELRRVTAAIAEKTSNIKNLQKKQETDQKTIQRLETKIMELETQVTERNEQYSRENATFYDDRRQKEELVSQKNELWRKQTALQQTLDTKREELRKKENDLRSLMGRPALRGHDAVQKVLKQWEQKQDKQHVIDGYHGMLIECILADENVFTAVDTTAGRLYRLIKLSSISLCINCSRSNTHQSRRLAIYIGGLQIPDLSRIYRPTVNRLHGHKLALSSSLQAGFEFISPNFVRCK